MATKKNRGGWALYAFDYSDGISVRRISPDYATREIAEKHLGTRLKNSNGWKLAQAKRKTWYMKWENNSVLVR